MPTYTPGTLYTATSELTSTNLRALVSSMTITNLTASQIDTSAASFVNISASDPGGLEGNTWWDKTNKKLSVHDGTNRRTIGVDFAATLPSATHEGHTVFDTTRDFLAVYDGTDFKTAGTHYGTAAPPEVVGSKWFDATNKVERLWDTINGITGWHPTDRGLALMTNTSANNILLGGAVVSNGGTAACEPTANEKDMRVIGVALEAIASGGGTGLVALIGSGMEVEVLVDATEADGAVIVYDLVCSSSTLNEARTAGVIIGNPYISTTDMQEGLPAGAFAMALESKDGSNLVRCVLLSQVGRGAWRTITREQIFDGADFTDDVWNEIDMTAHLSGAGSILTETKHAPILAVDIEVLAGNSTNNDGDNMYNISIGSERTSPMTYTFAGIRLGQSGLQLRYGHTFRTVVPTRSNNADANANLGNFIQVRHVENGQAVIDVFDGFALRYFY